MVFASGFINSHFWNNYPFQLIVELKSQLSLYWYQYHNIFSNLTTLYMPMYAMIDQVGDLCHNITREISAVPAPEVPGELHSFLKK